MFHLSKIKLTGSMQSSIMLITESASFTITIGKAERTC